VVRFYYYVACSQAFGDSCPVEVSQDEIFQEARATARFTTPNSANTRVFFLPLLTAKRISGKTH